MTIRREDLVAAAAVGLLQYRQVEPLLVFLLQRDVRAQREAMLARQGRQRLFASGINVALTRIVVVLALVTAILFAVLFSSRVVHAFGTTALLLFGSAYAAGGLGLAVPGHMWGGDTWGYTGLRGSREDLARNFEQVFRAVWAAKDEPGISAVVYTQLTDIEAEANGLFTYDRAVLKIPRARVIAATTGRFPEHAASPRPAAFDSRPPAGHTLAATVVP